MEEANFYEVLSSEDDDSEAGDTPVPSSSVLSDAAQDLPARQDIIDPWTVAVQFTDGDEELRNIIRQRGQADGDNTNNPLDFMIKPSNDAGGPSKVVHKGVASSENMTVSYTHLTLPTICSV